MSLRLRWRKERCYLQPMSGRGHRVMPPLTRPPVRMSRPVWRSVEPAYALMKSAKALPNVKFLRQRLGPFKLWTRHPLFWKIYHLLPTHTHTYKNTSVGQINLSRENRFLSNSVNCTELEREKCYFSSTKGKQNLSLFTLSSPFQKKVSLMPS